VSYPKVTIVGAGQVGATAAHALLLQDVADVVMIDVAEGLPQGKALDMMHARSVEHFGPAIVGTNDYADTAGSQVVVVTAGLARKPGMSRDDLLAKNSAIVRAVISSAVAVSPDAVIICVTNPLDMMTWLAWKTSGLPASRVIGMGGVLDSARFAFAIAEATGAPIAQVQALVVGAHGDAMVPLPRLSTVSGRPVTEVLSPKEVNAVVARTIGGGAEVVSLLQTGSAFYAPGASVAAMVAAVLGGNRAMLPSCVMLEGQYGIKDVYLSVPAVLGRGGVEGILELELDSQELAALRASARAVAEGLSALR
jgi:malate dehydrogenase